MDNRFPQAADHRPAPGVLGALESSCRVLLQDRALLDHRFLAALGSSLPEQHPLRRVPGAALDLLDVLLRAVLSGDPPESTESECQECGARCVAVGLPDDTFPAVARAAARVAREIAGDLWTSGTSSGWAAVHVWVVENLTFGASRGRAQAQAQFQGRPSAEGPGRDGPGDASPRASEWELLERAAGMRARPSPGRPPGSDGGHGRRAIRDPGQAPEWMREAWVPPEWVSDLWENSPEPTPRHSEDGDPPPAP